MSNQHECDLQPRWYWSMFSYILTDMTCAESYIQNDCAIVNIDDTAVLFP